MPPSVTLDLTSAQADLVHRSLRERILAIGDRLSNDVSGAPLRHRLESEKEHLHAVLDKLEDQGVEF